MFKKLFDNVEDTVGKIIQSIRESELPVMIFGAGYCSNLVINLLSENGISVENIIDNNNKKRGNTIDGIEIISIDEAIERYTDFQIVISTRYYSEIELQLSEIGFKGRVFHFPENAYYKNSLYNKSYITKYAEQFDKAYGLLQDEISQKVFWSICAHNMSLDNSYFDEIRKFEIKGYFDKTIYKSNRNEVYVDAGAFDGDSVEEFLRTVKGNYKNIYAFEPDEENYEILKLNKKIDGINIIKAGLGREKQVLKFMNSGNVSSRISPDGEVSIDIESIDSFFENKDYPTLIKMDIEGAEKDAIIGATKTIEKNLPTMIVSAYHKMEDMFDLILLLDKLSEGRYNFFLRHTFFYQEVSIQPDVIIYAKGIV